MLIDAVSSKNRLKILKQLTRKDKYFSEIMEQIKIDGKNLKHHLKTLEDEDIIRSYKEGKRRYYSLEKDIRLEITRPPQGRFMLTKTKE